MTTSRIPIDKQVRDLCTLVEAVNNGRGLSRGEIEYLQPSIQEAIRTLEFCRDNREAMRTVLMAAREVNPNV